MLLTLLINNHKLRNGLFRLLNNDSVFFTNGESGIPHLQLDRR